MDIVYSMKICVPTYRINIKIILYWYIYIVYYVIGFATRSCSFTLE